MTAELLVGGGIGFLASVLGMAFVDCVRAPQVERRRFTRERTSFGVVYKLGFKLTARWPVLSARPPGICFLEIEWPKGRAFAKWDEMPNPLDRDDPERFRAQLVPGTYYQALVPKREYRVPVVIEPPDDGHDQPRRAEAFSGWWFGRDKGYGPDPALADSDRITLTLTGAGLRWCESLSLSDLRAEVEGPESSPPASNEG